MEVVTLVAVTPAVAIREVVTALADRRVDNHSGVALQEVDKALEALQEVDNHSEVALPEVDNHSGEALQEVDNHSGVALQEVDKALEALQEAAEDSEAVARK